MCAASIVQNVCSNHPTKCCSLNPEKKSSLENACRLYSTEKNIPLKNVCSVYTAKCLQHPPCKMFAATTLQNVAASTLQKSLPPFKKFQMSCTMLKRSTCKMLSTFTLQNVCSINLKNVCSIHYAKGLQLLPCKIFAFSTSK